RELEEIGDALFDLAPAIRVGDQVNIFGLMFEDESFQNPGARIPRLRNRLPIARALEERLHAEARAPVEIVRRIVSIADPRGHGNDALILVVAKRDQDVNQFAWFSFSRLSGGVPVTRGDLSDFVA